MDYFGTCPELIRISRALNQAKARTRSVDELDLMGEPETIDAINKLDMFQSSYVATALLTSVYSADLCELMEDLALAPKGPGDLTRNICLYGTIIIRRERDI